MSRVKFRFVSRKLERVNVWIECNTKSLHYPPKEAELTHTQTQPKNTHLQIQWKPLNLIRVNQLLIVIRFGRSHLSMILPTKVTAYCYHSVNVISLSRSKVITFTVLKYAQIQTPTKTYQLQTMKRSIFIFHWTHC